MTADAGPVVSYFAQFSKIVLAASVKWLPQIGADNTDGSDSPMVG
jgi:hypothetical protein